jgi:hypothetical protein
VIDTAINPEVRFKVGDVMKCRYKGTKAQMTLDAKSAASIQNASEANGYFTW